MKAKEAKELLLSTAITVLEAKTLSRVSPDATYGICDALYTAQNLLNIGVGKLGFRRTEWNILKEVRREVIHTIGERIGQGRYLQAQLKDEGQLTEHQFRLLWLHPSEFHSPKDFSVRREVRRLRRQLLQNRITFAKSLLEEVKRS